LVPLSLSERLVPTIVGFWPAQTAVFPKPPTNWMHSRWFRKP
jgi:hypothetical protein